MAATDSSPAWLSIRFARRELALIERALSASSGSGAPVPFIFSRAEAAGRLVFVCARVGEASGAEAPFVNGLATPISAGETAFDERRTSWLGDEEPPRDGDAVIRVLIGSATDEAFHLACRVWQNDHWRNFDHAFLEGAPGSVVWAGDTMPVPPEPPPERVARFTSSFGIEAWQRLRRSTAVVVGAGGTGSVAIPILARAGVGRLVIVDSDHITPSNLERTHASFPAHVEAKTLKAELARDHVRQIDPAIEVIAFEGRLPQPEIVAEIARADVLIGCTDQHTSRLAVADMARRYLVPALDCGGLIEGSSGRVTGQIIQLVVFRPDDPCPACRGMVSPVRIGQELMSNEEREAIRQQAARREAIPPEAQDIPQIDTVGYITTVSGTLAAGYAIGWLTGRFDPPFERMQMNLIADCLDVTNRPQDHAPDCNCRESRGLADAGAALAPFRPPDHWAPARRIP